MAGQEYRVWIPAYNLKTPFHSELMILQILSYPRLVILKFCCKQQNLILADLAAYKNGKMSYSHLNTDFYFHLKK